MGSISAKVIISLNDILKENGVEIEFESVQSIYDSVCQRREYFFLKGEILAEDMAGDDGLVQASVDVNKVVMEFAYSQFIEDFMTVIKYFHKYRNIDINVQDFEKKFIRRLANEKISIYHVYNMESADRYCNKIRDCICKYFKLEEEQNILNKICDDLGHKLAILYRNGEIVILNRKSVISDKISNRSGYKYMISQVGIDKIEGFDNYKNNLYHWLCFNDIYIYKSEDIYKRCVRT